MKQMDVALDPMAGTASKSPVPAVLAIDPGPTQSGWCVLAGSTVMDSGVLANEDMLDMVTHRHFQMFPTRLAIEMIASYGMPVGREVFETCVWIGRFIQAWHNPNSVQLVYRKDAAELVCRADRLAYPVKDAIPVMLEDEARKLAADEDV